MKQKKYSNRAFLLAGIFALMALAITDVHAQRRSRGNSYDNTPATSNTHRSGGRTSNTGGSNNSMVSQGPGSVAQRTYASLYTQQKALIREADNLSAQISGATKSKARKLTKQLAKVNSELTIIERKISTYPRSITDPNYYAEQPAEENSGDLQRKIESLADEKLAAQDFDNTPMVDDDPELQRAYRMYQQFGEEAFTSQEEETPRAVYRVQIGTGLPGHASSFKGVDNVYEVDNGKGSSVYYSGSFRDLATARDACNKIKGSTRYKDAFVVAMNGDKRISLEQAKNLIR